jgi:hypothetical protein
MSNITRNAIMLPFLLIVVVSMTLGLQYSNVSVSGTETDESADTSEARRQESSETQSEDGSASSNTSGTETNLSESATKPFLSGLGDAEVPPTAGEVLDPGNTAPVGINVVTVVTFNSITVHNKHEGFASGDGEYDLAAYVQGKQVDLTHASGPGDGLNDVSNGETLAFKRSNVAIQEIPNNIPLSIFTVGHELDACDSSFKFPQNIQQTLPIFFDPGLDWSSEISKFQKYLNYDYWVCHSASGNDDEILGTIKEFYDPPDYGAGSHAVKSSNGDFTLRYTISKGDACNASIC